jgi:hypothetical protein
MAPVFCPLQVIFVDEIVLILSVVFSITEVKPRITELPSVNPVTYTCRYKFAVELVRVTGDAPTADQLVLSSDHCSSALPVPATVNHRQWEILHRMPLDN